MDDMDTTKINFQYQDLFEHASDAIFLSDTLGNYIDVNLSGCTLLGYTKEEILKLNVRDIVSEEELKDNPLKMEELFTGKNITNTRNLKRKDGKLIKVELSAKLIKGKVFQAIVRDISEDTRTKLELSEAQIKYQLLFEHTGVGVVLIDCDSTKILDANQKFTQILGYSNEELKQRTFVDITYSDDTEINLSFFYALMEGRINEYSIEKRYVHKNGSIIWAHLTVSTWKNIDEQKLLIAVVVDISEKKKSEKALIESENKFRALFEQAAVGVALIDTETGIFLQINQRFTELLGYHYEEIRQLSIYDLIYPDDIDSLKYNISKLKSNQISHFSLDKRFVNRRKKVLWINLTVSPTWRISKNSKFHICIAVDITDQKYILEKVEYLAHYDQLTKLPNRINLMNKLEESILNSVQTNCLGAVLFLDLDRFKHVNDSLGHFAGDKLLVQVAERLKFCTKYNDVVSRLGGDEFIVVINGVCSISEIDFLVQSLLIGMSQDFQIQNHNINITPSIGISIFPMDGKEPEVLLKKADTAMYIAKKRGRNNYQFYTKEHSPYTIEKLSLENDLHYAKEKEEFIFHYQPIINTINHQILSVETLIRWNHPTYGLLYPKDFIPILEDIGQINQITDWIIEQTILQAKEWKEKNILNCSISINLPATALLGKNFLELLNYHLSKNNVESKYIELEVNENIFTADFKEVAEKIKQLNQMGIKMNIDDFGTGYFNLAKMKQIPIHRMKIDNSFFQNIRTDEDREMVQTFKHLADCLKIEPIAEGIEDMETMKFLQSIQIHIMQGYFLYKPMPSKNIEDLFLNYKKI